MGALPDAAVAKPPGSREVETPRLRLRSVSIAAAREGLKVRCATRKEVLIFREQSKRGPYLVEGAYCHVCVGVCKASEQNAYLPFHRTANSAACPSSVAFTNCVLKRKFPPLSSS
jgi:hypothetical protein